MLGTLLTPSNGGDLDPEEFKMKYRNNPGVIIDVRTPEEFHDGHLKDADHQFDFLTDEFEKEMAHLDKNQTYYLYCRTGNRSGKAMEKMHKAGFKEVYNIGGFEDLVSSGLPSDK